MIVELRAWYARADARGRLDAGRYAWPLLALAVLASGGLLFHLTRGTTFWSDDWLWITRRRGDSLNTFLSPYNGHLSLIPLAIYRLLFSTAGLATYTPYRGLTIVLSLVVGVVVFVYARRRTHGSVALVLAALMLFLGPGWQNTMWGFQIPWLIVCAAGIIAFMLLERHTRRADAAVCALLALMLCSTSLGLAFCLGIAAEIALVRRRWRDAWIVAVPLALYALWSVHYHASTIELSGLPAVPGNIAQAAATSLAALSGISGASPLNETANSLTYGWPLLALVLVLAAWRARVGGVTPRLFSLVVTFLIFTASVSVVHAGLASPLSSRYVYVYGLLAVLIIAELAGPVPLRGWMPWALYAVAVAAIVSNVGTLKSFGLYLRESGSQTRGALTGLDIDRGHVDPDVRVQIAEYQFLGPSSRSVLAAEHAFGSPAYSLPGLRGDRGGAQQSADSQLLADDDVVLGPGHAVPGVGAVTGPPTVTDAGGGVVTRTTSCLRFVPSSVLPPGGAATLTLVGRPPGLSITTTAGPASLSARRFAGTFLAIGSVVAHGSASVTIRNGLAPDPWYLQLSSSATVRVCSR